MKLKGKRVLVTGGAGFIGSHTVDALISLGAQVTVIDNLSTGSRSNLNPKAKFYETNVADSGIEEILEREKPQIIYHFSFFVLVPKSVENPLLDIDNVIGSIRILKKAKEMGGLEKFVFISSGFLYGNTRNLPAKETEPMEFITPYVVTKNAIENYLKFYKKSFAIPYVILRYAAVYGPRQVTGAMADYIRKLSAGQQADIWGDGTKTRDYVYIDDVVRANLAVLDIPNNHQNPVFNIGTGKETTLNTVYFKIAELLGVKGSPIYHPDRPGEQMRYSLDYGKINNELGWEPQVKLEEGLAKILSFGGLHGK
jgi:UDP-glucose 4-epimerase